MNRLEDELGKDIPDALIRELEEVFPSNIDTYFTDIHRMEDVKFIQGQRSVVQFIKNLKDRWENNILK